jgi:hypothetical protein
MRNIEARVDDAHDDTFARSCERRPRLLESLAVDERSILLGRFIEEQMKRRPDRKGEIRVRGFESRDLAGRDSQRREPRPKPLKAHPLRIREDRKLDHDRKLAGRIRQWMTSIRSRKEIDERCVQPMVRARRRMNG